jgi:hypothetical protein
MSYKDPRIQLALGGFLLFFIAWCVLTANSVPDTNSLMAFVQKGAFVLGSAVLLFIKTGEGDGGKMPDVAALAAAVAAALPPAPAPSADTGAPTAAPPGQAGRAMPFLLLILAVGAALVLGGCGTLNAWNSAALTTGAADYTGMRQNIQKTDDMKLQGWIDAACAMNVGALQRAASTSGNGNAITAVFTACPVPGVGVTSNMPNGSLTVQTTTLQAPATPK